jgi:hypothetical protein
MSSKLVEERRNRIHYMLKSTADTTKLYISCYESDLPSFQNPNPKQIFNRLTWIEIEEFIAKMAYDTGLRDRVLHDYFNILKNSGKIEIHRENTHYFRNTEVIQQYLVQHPELK